MTKFGILAVDKSVNEETNDISYTIVKEHTIEGMSYQEGHPVIQWIEENKDKGIFEYTESYLFLNAFKSKTRELEKAYLEAQTCKIINGHTFIIPLSGNFFTQDIKGQVDEANLLGSASLVCKDIEGKTIILKDLPKELWNYFWQQAKPLSTKNFAIKELLNEKIKNCTTVEELNAIDILAVLPPSTLEIQIDLPKNSELQNEVINEEVNI